MSKVMSLKDEVKEHFSWEDDFEEKDEVVVFDGLGNEYSGQICEAKRKSLVVLIQNKINNPIVPVAATI